RRVRDECSLRAVRRRADRANAQAAGRYGWRRGPHTMSQERSMQSHALPARRHTQISLKHLKRAPVLNVIGVPELFGLVGAAFLALITIFAYFYFFLPSHSRLRSAQLERELLQGKLRESQKIVQENTSTRETVDKITTSLEDFESNRLAARET